VQRNWQHFKRLAETRTVFYLAPHFFLTPIELSILSSFLEMHAISLPGFSLSGLYGVAVRLGWAIEAIAPTIGSRDPHEPFAEASAAAEEGDPPEIR
jgi:hypothetical protein